jgi:hypothetical protein
MKYAAFLAGVLAAWPQIAMAQQAIVLDRYMSPTAGTTDLLTVQHELAAFEDRVLPLKLGDEQRRLPLVAGILYRAGKFVGVDVPQDHMLLVLGHEVFGHGARLRELGVGRIRYSFDGPIPYGAGGAVTSFNGEFPITPLASLTIEMAGIEAQNTMADSIAETALACRRIHYREAWLYFETRYLGMTYILGASEQSKEGHDVADFFRTFRDACKPPGCKPITLSDLKKGARLTLVDPLLYFSLYGFASSYIAQGNATLAIPMIPLGHAVRYLPSVGFQMTPYGTEHIFRNTFVSGPTAQGNSVNVTSITLRFGTTGASRPWAIDVRAADVRLFRGIHGRAAADIWRQPPILADQTSAPLKSGAAAAPLKTGVAAAATIVLPLGKLIRQNWLNATITAGYKSEGFVPGEQVSKGVILRAGVAIDRQ